MSIGVLLPSRGRPDSLIASVHSLWVKAEAPDSLNIYVGYDIDDLDTARAADSLGVYVVPFKVRHGYTQLHRYVNKLAESSVDDWLLLWNDDATMETYYWDSIVYGYSSSYPVVLSPSSTGVNHDMCCFPIVSRCMYSIIGHMSLSNHIDSWLQDLANALGLLRKLDVHVYHDRFDLTGGHNDQTFAESSSGYRTVEFYSDSMQSLLRNDIEKVRAWLNSDGSVSVN